MRIYTLGRFDVLLEDKPLKYQGKARGKPMRLLQALIAMRGHEVAVGNLLDDLWPDAEGDAAENDFNVTLLRLRRLIGHRAVLLSDRRLSLNDRYCWVDAWSLERLDARTGIETGAAGVGVTDIVSLSAQVFAIYNGPFLEHEDAAWATLARKRLRGRFLHVLRACARSLRANGSFDEAAALCRRALDVEPLAEEILAELVKALVAAGRSVEAITAVEDATPLFVRELGRPPLAELSRLAGL